MGRAFPVPGHLDGQIPAYSFQGFQEQVIFPVLLRDDRVPRQAAGQHQQGIVGAGIPVNGDHVEGIGHHRLHRLPQQRRIHGAVRGKVGQHGAHIGVDHPGALAHAPQGYLYVSFTAGRGQFKAHRRFLGYRVRGHDGFRRQRRRLPAAAQAARQGPYPRLNPDQGDVGPNDPGGADQHPFRGNVQRFPVRSGEEREKCD